MKNVQLKTVFRNANLCKIPLIYWKTFLQKETIQDNWEQFVRKNI